MVLALSYGDLSNTISETNKLANELGQYCDNLSKKVQQKMYSVEGGMSSALNSADYYVNEKIKQLRAREKNARTLSSRTQILLDTAKRVDLDVEKTIYANQKAFYKMYPKLRPSKLQQAWTSFMCDMRNSKAIGWLIRGGEQLASALDTLLKDIRHWYKCGGGKELIGIALGVVGALLAVVAVVCAIAVTGGTVLAIIVGVVGVIGALIGLVNAATNVVTSIQAYNEAIGGHPGRAKIYARQDKLSDVLSQTNFHDKRMNRSSNAWAMGLDITEAICDVVSIASGAVKTFKAISKVNISRTIRSMCQPRNELGQFIQGKPTLWNGIKSVAMKFNIKDLLLGDMNVKNLSRLSKIPTVDAFKTINSLTKAVKGVVGGLDKVNEGKMTMGQFLASRALKGVDQALFKGQELNTKMEDGEGRVRKYRDTNFTKIINAVREPIDSLGLGKILTDKIGGSSLSDTLNMKGGLYKSATSILDAIKTFNTGNAPDINIPKAITPKVDTTLDLSVKTFTMPSLDFNLKFECSYPYLNVKAA